MESFVPPGSIPGWHNNILVKANEQIPPVITSHPKYQKVTVITVVTTQQIDSIISGPLIFE